MLFKKMLMILIVLLIKKCLCVPPILQPDLLKDEFNGLKSSMNTVIGFLDKWNNLYMNQIEPKILSYSVTMTNLDTNIRNLQERAHIWDTFQLHISAWNEQLATTDRKLDIISEGQEKLLNLENKINSLNNLDYKMEFIKQKLESLEEQISITNKNLENHNTNRENLVTEFTTRGILSTLKLIERKLDKPQINTYSSIFKKHINDDNKKLSIKCNTPPIIEELLHDVASKVDVIFDKFSEQDEIIENIYGNDEEYLDDQQISNDEESDFKNDSDVKLLKKILARLNQPCKKSNTLLDKILAKVSIIQNNTSSPNKTHLSFKNEQTCDLQHVKIFFDKGIEKIINRFNESERHRDLVTNSHFSEQRAHFERILQSNLCLNQKNNSEKNPIPETSIPDLTVNNENVDITIVLKDIKSCEELDNTYSSGVYEFIDDKIDEVTNMLNNQVNKRYCEIRNDGKWTVIQARGFQIVPQNFSMNWTEYKNGFGQLNGDFWLGNDFIHKLTNTNNSMLRIELENFEGNTAWAEYGLFQVESEQNAYKLTIGDYTGNASDSFSSHNNSLFSTFDRKNDDAPECCPCALSYGGGWWFNSCFEVNLNGDYHNEHTKNDYYRGLIWENWLGDYSLKKTKMMVKSRPKQQQATTILPITIQTTTDSSPEVTTMFEIPFYEDP